MVPIFPPLVKIFNIFGSRQLQAMLHKNAQCLIQWRQIRGQIAFLRDLQKDKESNANATRVENPKKCVLWSLLKIVWTQGDEHQEQKVAEKGEVRQQSLLEEFNDP